MTDSVGVLYQDTFSIAFNLHSYRLLKHLLAAPFLVACVLIVVSLLLTSEESETSILKF